MIENLEKPFTIDGNEESRVPISDDEKVQLDKIMTAYPYMFPSSIVVLWREKIREAPRHYFAPFKDLNGPSSYTIPPEFKGEVEEEYNHRVREYYEATGQNHVNLFGTTTLLPTDFATSGSLLFHRDSLLPKK